MSRKPNFDELVGAELEDAERERLRGAHELLLQAGPPPELPPQLWKAPEFGVVSLKRRVAKKRPVLLLLAAALSTVAIFAAGYAVANQRGGSGKAAVPARLLALRGTSIAPHARATLEVWHSRAGNWPMTLSVVGLPKLPARKYYYVYLVRDGRPWGSCGSFRVRGSGAVTLTLNAPYPLQKGDSWVVTRAGANGSEPGKTVLSPVSV